MIRKNVILNINWILLWCLWINCHLVISVTQVVYATPTEISSSSIQQQKVEIITTTTPSTTEKTVPDNVTDEDCVQKSYFVFNYKTTASSISIDDKKNYKFNYLKVTKIGNEEDSYFLYDPEKIILSGLSPCSSYDVFAELKNLITNVTFNHTEIIRTNYSMPITKFLPPIPFSDTIEILWNSKNYECVNTYKIYVSSLINSNYNYYDMMTTKMDYFSIENLLPCTIYQINLLTIDINDNIVGNITENVTTSEIDPSSVRSLSAIHLPNGKMKLTWEQPEDASTCVQDYTVMMEIDDCSENSCSPMYQTKNSSTLSAIFTHLKKCENYVASVFVNSLKSNDTAAVVVIPGEFGHPGPVMNVEYERLSPVNVSLTWDPPEINPGCVKNYRIMWALNSVDVDETGIMLEDMEPCKIYMVRIFVIDINDNMGAYTEINITMLDDKPSTVQNPNPILTPSEMYLSWQPPAYASLCVIQYRIAVWDENVHPSMNDQTNNSVTNIFDVKTNETFYNFKNLTSCQKLSIQIIAEAEGSRDGELLIFTVAIPSRVSLPTSPPVLLEKSKSTFRLQASYIDERNECELFLAKFICFDELTGIFEETEIAVESTEAPFEFEGIVENLLPYTSYKCYSLIRNLAGWSDASFAITYMTDEDYPGPPDNLLISTVTSQSMNFNWSLPKYPNGKIRTFQIYIQALEPKYIIPSDCEPFQQYNNTIETKDLEYLFDKAQPYVEYMVQVSAVNDVGIGVFSQPVFVTTLPDQSEKVSNFTLLSINGPFLMESYNASVTIGWTIPCRANGEIQMFEGYFHGVRSQYNDHIFNWSLPIDDDFVNDSYMWKETKLLPEYNYKVYIYTRNSHVADISEPTFLNFESPSGIPETYNVENWGSADVYSAPNPTQNALVKISTNILNSTMGEILFVALLISEHGCQNDPKLEFNLTNSLIEWPATKSWLDVNGMDCIPQYQTTPIRWRPEFDRESGINETASFTFLIGDGDCSEEIDYCNGPLKPDTYYGLIVRTFTRSGYSDSALIYFPTDALIALSTIVILVFACLLFAFFIGLFILWRSKSTRWNSEKFIYNEEQEKGDISIKQFSTHYTDLIRNGNEKMSKEFKLLNASNVDKNFTIIAAKQNRWKNRYNIVPYDANRVLLDLEEGESDYINASYINGFRRHKEYIATQGPKLETCFDFWRMIIQCNVKTIVMLTPLREGDTIKCCEYYPVATTRSKSIQFKDITIYFVKEIDFSTYKKRVFRVERGKHRKTLVQYHFTKWPDHGCPKNPKELIDFTKLIQMEKRHAIDPIVVHCSAGIGRTGTYIALDIIMQQIRYHKKINIYETVRQLRLQRMKMVMTFHQYYLLYQCSLMLAHKKEGDKLLKNFETDVDGSGMKIENRRTIIVETPPNTSIQSISKGITGPTSFMPNDIESAM